MLATSVDGMEALATPQPRKEKHAIPFEVSDQRPNAQPKDTRAVLRVFKYTGSLTRHYRPLPCISKLFYRAHAGDTATLSIFLHGW